MNTITLVFSNLWAISGIILGLGFICEFDRILKIAGESHKKFPQFSVDFYHGVALIAVLFFILIPFVNTVMAIKVLRRVGKYVWHLRHPSKG